MPEKPLRIIVVEDDEDTREALKGFLESLGHEVTATSGIRSAREAFAAATFDFLLCDIGLPDGTGWDLRRQLRAPNLVSAAMSGFGRNADRIRSSGSGFQYHLLKPFDPEELEEILSAVGGPEERSGAAS